MKMLEQIIGIFIIVCIAATASAAADAMSVSQQIYIRGVVPPMRFIVVNDKGLIVELTSNTVQNIPPIVRLSSISKGKTLPLTSSLADQYRAKTLGHDMHSLDLHFTVTSVQAPAHTSPGWLSELRHLSILRLPTGW